MVVTADVACIRAITSHGGLAPKRGLRRAFGIGPSRIATGDARTGVNPARIEFLGTTGLRGLAPANVISKILLQLRAKGGDVFSRSFLPPKAERTISIKTN
jgi:hypothetical protein